MLRRRTGGNSRCCWWCGSCFFIFVGLLLLLLLLLLGVASASERATRGGHGRDFFAGSACDFLEIRDRSDGAWRAVGIEGTDAVKDDVLFGDRAVGIGDENEHVCWWGGARESRALFARV